MLAVQKSLENIGEACISIEKIDPSASKKTPEFPFSDLASFKNKINHWYFQVEFDEVWVTATEEIPELESVFYAHFEGELEHLRNIKSPESSLNLYKKLEGSFLRRGNFAEAMKTLDEREKAKNTTDNPDEPTPGS
jgi:hypothetical protein